MDRNFISFWQYKIFVCPSRIWVWLSFGLAYGSARCSYRCHTSTEYIGLGLDGGLEAGLVERAERQHNITFSSLSLLLLLLPCIAVAGIPDAAAAATAAVSSSFLSLRCATAN